MKKPYDTTPIAMDTAEEPALAYAYTHEQTRHGRTPAPAGKWTAAPPYTPTGRLAPTETQGVSFSEWQTIKPIDVSAEEWDAFRPREDWEIGYDEEDKFELTEEEKQFLDERLEGIEDGTAVLIPHEEVMKEREIWRKQRKERYATV